MRPSNRLLGSSTSAKPRSTSTRRRRLPRPALGRWLRRGAFVGVDIGTTAVKLVELSPNRQATGNAGHPAGSYRVQAFGLEPLPPGTVSGAQANISDPAAVGEAIRRLRLRTHAKARNAALAIPHAAAVVKTLRLDATLTDEEMEMEIALEAERLFPFSLEETALDFEPAQLCPDDPALVEVIVVGCRLEHAHSRQAAAAAGGFKATVLEVETMALARATALAPPASVALVDLGDRKATFLATHGGVVLFTRQEPFDAHQTDAEGAPGTEDLVRHISRLLRLFFAAQGNDRRALDRLLVSGGRAGTPGLAETATRRLGLPVALADPFDQMAFAAHLPSRSTEAPAGIALAALRDPPRDCDAVALPQNSDTADVAPAQHREPRVATFDGTAAKAPLLTTACGLALRGVAIEPSDSVVAARGKATATAAGEPR